MREPTPARGRATAAQTADSRPSLAARWVGVERARPGALWRLLLYVVAYLAATAIVTAFVAPLVGAIHAATGVRIIAYPWIYLASALLAHLAAMRGIEQRAWREVGLGRDALRPAPLAAATLLGALAVGLPALLLVAVGLLRFAPAPAGSWLAAAVGMLLFMAPAALFEEVLVRGYPFQVLREVAGPAAALLVTSVVFGVLHLQNPGANAGSTALVTLAGIFLGAIVLVTGSLWAAWTAHLAWNWTMGALLHAPVSGLPFETPGYRLVDAGPDWLTGGAWGPEGGAGAAAGMLASLTYLWMRGRRTSAAAAASRTPDARPAGRGSF